MAEPKTWWTGLEHLYRFKIVGDPCCSSEKEIAQHVLFSCPRFDDIRYKLQTSFGELVISQETFAVSFQIDLLCKQLVEKYCYSNVLSTLKDKQTKEERYEQGTQ